jgi:dsRNA-specific ribonuclease
MKKNNFTNTANTTNITNTANITNTEFDANNIFKNNNFKLHILNEKNIPITKEFIESVFKKYDFNHEIQNLENYQLAMIHVSYLNRSTITEKTARLLKDVLPIDDEQININNVFPLQEKCYGRLEYKGDAVLHHIIADYLFERYPNEDEGFMTKLRTKLEKCETFSELAKKLGLHKYAIIARNIEQSGGRYNNTHLTEDIFEAFFGALSLECDYKNCSTFFVNIIEKEIDIAELIYVDDNYKDRIMQYFHKMKWPEPKYIEDTKLSREAKDNEPRIFVIYVKNPMGKIIGVGEGHSKAKAEQLAAFYSLIELGVIKPDQKNDNDYYGEISDDDLIMENYYD